ncbi:hypothetical protein SCHPADRAFT_922215 [Schizopora paradoxa]|uniref:Uncharacterized protein n=1 Tax=Schizopora paradoxa TaxID=27342 RepID=A0A0H2RDX7_9AGAM|nr:hypothetical protein SCHPADRAFT_922215 [Schizopora paradoxa]
MAVSTQRLPPPPMPLNLPEPPSDRERRGRPPSPLRNIHTVDPVTGEISEESSYHTADTVQDDRAWSQRSHSPSPSLTKFASNFAQRVGSLVGGMAPPPRSASGSTMLSDAELEAEAEREREWSRREAEMIMKREAEERKMVEDGVFALMNNAKEEHPLPPPPPRSQTLSNPPSPASSQKEKEGNWFTAVKNKLTPSKDPLTPAQQVIQEAKAKEKEQKKKGKDKERAGSQDWPAVPNSRTVDPAFANLLSSASEDIEHHTPPRPIAQYNPMMTPSPKRSNDAETALLYAQYNAQGALDVQGSLLTIARRFEKLERWTVSHVRALEERMGDVERWLVEKEKEKGEKGEDVASENSIHSSFNDNEQRDKDNELSDVREELAELQGRMGELGREMAKLMTAPPNLNAGPARNAGATASPTNSLPLTPSSIIPRSLPIVPSSGTPQRTPSISSQSRGRELSSPPSLHTSGSRTRLPYPTGDYTSPTSDAGLKNDILSPASSPPPSIGAARKRPMSIAGLPSAGGSISSHLSSASTSGLPRPSSVSPLEVTKSKPISTVSLVAPPKQTVRQSSVSPTPTPRKRYTVALGKPIHGPDNGDDDEDDEPRRSQYSSIVSTPDNITDSEASDVDDGDSEARRIGHTREDTVGKSEHRKSSAPATPNDSLRRSNAGSFSPRSTNVTPRARAQSSYGPITGSSSLASPSPSSSVSPLKPRVRSQSTDRIGLGISVGSSGPQSKFVDPLVARKQEKEAALPKTPKTPAFGRGKVPIGQLVAFFDGDKK